MSRRNVTRCAVAVCALLAASAGAVRGQSAALIGNVDFGIDAAGVHVSQVRLGGLYPFGSYMDRIGVPVEASPQPLASRAPGAAIGLWRNDGAATTGIDAEAGVVEVGGHVRTIGDATWRIKPGRGTSVELLAAGDLVGTQQAAGLGIGYGFVGSSVEQALAERISATCLAGYQSFADGNGRAHLRAGLVWHALPSSGIDVQWRWRRFDDARDVVQRPYFNPGGYSQNQVATGIRRQFGGWTLSAAIGAGYETIDGTDTRPVRTAELRGEAKLGERAHVALYAGYDHSASDIDFPDHSARQIGAALTWPF